MKTNVLVLTLMLLLQVSLAYAQVHPAIDLVDGLDRPFGLGGRSCKQYDDTGRLYIYTEGMPSHSVLAWLQQSDGGTKANVTMPEELIAALPQIPGCLPGKHHATRLVGQTPS